MGPRNGIKPKMRGLGEGMAAPVQELLQLIQRALKLIFTTLDPDVVIAHRFPEVPPELTQFEGSVVLPGTCFYGIGSGRARGFVQFQGDERKRILFPAKGSPPILKSSHKF